MTVALALIMLCVAACSILAVGPAESLNRVAAGMNGLVDGFTSPPAR